ncbi:MAG: hypothetical protein JNM46_00285 [Anaerolineales bacterium]|nr:hypothetical protein [Anaerolineales bacterium]
MDNLFAQSQFLNNSNQILHPIDWTRSCLQVVKTIGEEHESITEIITQLALHGSFNIIAGDEWLPDRDTLFRSVRRYTTKVDEILDRPKTMRPMTCLQLLDLLVEVSKQNKPILILNFLYHFYNGDVDLSLRNRVIKQCCEQLKIISLSNPIVVLVPTLSIDAYHQFFPILASFADEVISIEQSADHNSTSKKKPLVYVTGSRNLTNTELANKLISEIKPLAELLAPVMQKILENFYNYILQFRASIASATNLLPLEAALLVIQAQEHINNNHEVVELHKRIDGLEKRLEELTSIVNEKN